MPECSFRQASNPIPRAMARSLTSVLFIQCLDGFLVELQEDSFPLVLKSRQPGNFPRQRCPLHSDIQFAFNIRRSRFKPREADLGDDLPQTVNQHDPLNRSHPRLIPDLSRQVASVEDAVWAILADFVLCRNQCFKLGNLDGLSVFVPPNFLD